MTEYDAPRSLATLVARAERPLLIGLDVDGVLAPIVRHADQAELTEGVGEALITVAELDDTHVAVVSGRSVDNLRRFEFSDQVAVVGSHGMEIRGLQMAVLEPDEIGRLSALVALAESAAERAGEGAWVEHKPISVAVHVREADRDAGSAALQWLADEATRRAGVTVKAGSAVLEVFTRSASKGDAMRHLSANCAAATSVFIGDDVTDEDAFAALAKEDITIKVGDDPTIASHRLADPTAVLEFLRRIAGAK